MEAVLVMLDRDGMALVRCRRTSGAVAACACARVYDITGAGDMVLSVVGRLSIARRRRLRRSRLSLGNIAGMGSKSLKKSGVVAFEREGKSSATSSTIIIPEDSKIYGPRFFLLAEVHRMPFDRSHIVVFTNGCFDYSLHPGHVRLVREAAKLGDFLVVGLNSDASIAD